ncbi:uncharacterized protein LOC131063223 isoform X2 [Cryptomeria japonica]|uniref:uncharacterized protein LOC131063223 isoform X2 n=1 Tax=Cryptomeria japonica TaxID=3369 RepID=UPI0027DA5FB9|nr:uncharacterized protein LOC131063223 isoform X2 [Cryptomeria japonica]
MIVPATNVEVMKLEHFLEDQDKYIAKNAGGCSSLTDQTKFSAMEDLPSSDSDHEEEDVTGTSDSEEPEVERRKLNAKLEFLDVMLQRIREEERLRRASGPPGNTSSYLMREHQWNQFDGDYYKNLPNPVSNIPPSDACLEEDTPLLDSTEVKKRIFADRKIDVSWTRIENNSAKDAGGSAPSLTEVVSKPDLDGAEDRILLDKLSIRELQDTFKATFGRETSVKDKQWLKRRISIALKNSNKKNGQEYMTSRHGKSPSEKFPTDSSDVQATKSKMIIDNTDIGVPISPIGNKSSTTSFTDVFIKREFGMSNGDVPLREEIRRKRTRKPTRREDSLGGCGIQIPFVLRVRRGRPRKNCGALVKQKTSESPTSFLKKAHVQEEQCSSDNGDMKQIVPFGSTQNFVYDDKENNEQMLISVPTDGKCVAEPFNSDSVDDVSDNYVSTIRTAKGGIRRKHHRSWTLQEVMKLVDGVSRFGVGRWSDIRKLVFSSSGYRTSVDLKDKWRNLLRASNAQLQTKKEAGNRKKHSSSPIPAPILARVRELSAMQSQALCLPSSSNPVIRSGRILHKRNPIQIKVECT